MSRPAAVSRRSTKSEYIETDTGNKISRRAHIEGKSNIMLGGKTVVMAGVHMRGDLYRKSERGVEGEADKGLVVTIQFGRACVVCTNCTIRPPIRTSRGQMLFYPMKIGNNVFIGPGTHVSAARIYDHIHIGANCILGQFCIINSRCKILPNTTIPPYTVVPPGSVMGGQPARIVGEVGEGWGQGGGEGEEWVEGGDLRALVRTIK